MSNLEFTEWSDEIRVEVKERVQRTRKTRSKAAYKLVEGSCDRFEGSFEFIVEEFGRWVGLASEFCSAIATQRQQVSRYLFSCGGSERWFSCIPMVESPYVTEEDEVSRYGEGIAVIVRRGSDRFEFIAPNAACFKEWLRKEIEDDWPNDDDE